MFDKVLEKIFSVKNAEGCNNKVYKVITILGIKLKIKNNKKTFEKQQNILFNQMLEYQKMLITTPYVFQGRNLWEVPFFEKFANKLLNTDYEQDYKSLIKNLDKKSVETVNRILARIIYVKTHDANGYDIFTTEEKEVIRLIPQVFNNNILKLNEHCYAYNHYFLSENHFEVNVFRDKHELESLNINYFKDKNIIDAGGFIGDSAIVLSDYTTKNVYSFEPVKNNYDKMLQTIHLNNKNNIIPIYCGLGEAEYNVNMLGEQGSGCSVDISKKDEDAGVVKFR